MSKNLQRHTLNLLIAAGIAFSCSLPIAALAINASPPPFDPSQTIPDSNGPGAVVDPNAPQASDIVDPWAQDAADKQSFLGSIKVGSADTGRSAGMAKSKGLPAFVGSIIQGLMDFLGILLIVYVIYGGAMWMTSQGEAEKIKKAKGILTSAVIGLAIVFAGWQITDIVIKLITNAYVS